MPLQTSTKKSKSKKVKEDLKPHVSQFQEGFMKELENMQGIKDQDDLEDILFLLKGEAG